MTELRAQGAISGNPRRGWRLGWLSLGDEALTFRPPGGRGAVRIDLGSVTRLDVERGRFVLTAKRVIRLTYRPSRVARPRACWVITARIGDWEEALSRRVTLPAAEAPLAAQAKLPEPHELAAELAGLSGEAELLLDYLAPGGHATTAELLALIGPATEEALLLELEEGFRRIEPTPGSPAIRYEGVRFDRRSAAVRRQSWWVDDILAERWLAARVPTDVLLEPDELVVVTSVPTQARGAPPSVRVDSDGCGLVVRGARGYQRWILLPEAVVDDTQCALSATGTLVIRARRKRRGTGRQETGTDSERCPGSAASPLTRRPLNGVLLPE